MAERFNSGMGGVTCDNCGILICAGVKGKRIFCYSTKVLIEYKDEHYCSKKCLHKVKENTKKRIK